MLDLEVPITMGTHASYNLLTVMHAYDPKFNFATTKIEAIANCYKKCTPEVE